MSAYVSGCLLNTSRAITRNLFDFWAKIKHIFEIIGNIVDFFAYLFVFLFVLEHLFEKGIEMSAQILEFPVDRVRKPVSRVRTSNYQTQVIQVPTSVKVARALVFWTLVCGTVYALIFSAFLNNGSAQANDSIAGSTTQFAYVTVQPGDTLWSLAQRYAPNRDPRDFIDDLSALNSLDDSVISAGMQLALPNK